MLKLFLVKVEISKKKFSWVKRWTILSWSIFNLMFNIFEILPTTLYIHWNKIKAFFKLFNENFNFLWIPIQFTKSNANQNSCLTLFLIYLEFFQGKRTNPLVSCKLFHWIELIVQNELPYVASAFKISGVPPSQICQLWFQQSFLNFLNFHEISLLVVGSVVIGVEFHIYVTVSLFKYMRDDILEQSQNGNLLMFLKTHPISGYCFQDFVEFFKELQDKYQKEMISDLENLCWFF